MRAAHSEIDPDLRDHNLEGAEYEMTTTTPAAITHILNWQKENAGKVPYSETASTRLDSGTAADLLTATDCSGMAHRMVKHFAGIDIGTYTGNECTHGTLVTKNQNAAATGYGMLPGDCILFDWDGGDWDHIAIYAGNGRIWNHGGPGSGPLNWSLEENVNKAVKVMVRRFIEWPSNTVTHEPITSGSKANPMNGKPVPPLIARGTGDYYGLITGPNDSHGGWYASEQPNIRLIQRFLIWNQKADLTVDGIFASTTAAAVADFQRSYMPDTEFYGQVWYDDWAKMASL